MNAHDEERIRQLLKQALPPAGNAEPSRDLWPAMMRRLDARPSPPPWFDWALAGALLAFVAFVPASIPVLLYYL
ncbi:MAG: hypothetical protein WAM85_03380 [Terracidiphilus sp.]